MRWRRAPAAEAGLIVDSHTEAEQQLTSPAVEEMADALAAETASKRGKFGAMREPGGRLLSLGAVALAAALISGLAAGAERVVVTVASKDGTPISVECIGSGPTLLLVHGGTGDRTRWTPLLPLFAPRVTACAMDRRGHGKSGDAREYSLQKEAEDVAAVVESRPGKVFVLGHSFGGVASLEAAFLTDKIAKLILYEPPVRNPGHAAILDRMEKLIAAGDREAALVAFFGEIVMISPAEIALMKTRPSWPGLLASVESSIRQDRALSAYRFDAARMRTLQTPALLLMGGNTASPQLKRAIDSLGRTLPHAKLTVFPDQEHNAMDAIPREFADKVLQFIAGG
jgi:pimeloyl-ACP methyl ester carboxylesterase